MRTRYWWLLLVLALAAGCAPDPTDPHEVRSKALLECIEDNLHRGAHFQKSADADTIAAVRAFATEPADADILVELLGSERSGVAVTAQLVLQAMGERVLPLLRAAEGSPDPRVGGLAAQAVVAIEADAEAQRAAAATEDPPEDGE